MVTEGNFLDNSPLVSIGVPVFNGGQFIEECLESILNQSYSNWECIVVDNCSKDNTNELVRNFLQRDKRFSLYENKKFLSVSDNWNESFAHISEKAAYFKIVPADDWIFPDFLKELVNLMEVTKDAGIGCSYRLDGLVVRGSGLDFYSGNVFNGKRILVDELLSKTDVTGSGNSVIYRIATLKQLKEYPMIFSNESLHGDTELAFNLLFISNLVFVFKVLSYTRRHNSSITSSFAMKINTSICFKDNQMIKYAGIIENFKIRYRNYRLGYADFYVKRMLKNDIKTIRWHNENMKNKMKVMEILRTFLPRRWFVKNFISCIMLCCV
jgi:glycosyltransferase involved in cell wall biosynthesis